MELYIAEKPSVGRTIASVIGANERRDGYWEGNGRLVSWCIGHLVALAMPEAYRSEYQRWRYSDLPILPDKWQYTVVAETKKQFDLLRRLMHDSRVTSLVCATDAGREGELIFRLVYAMADCRKEVRRLWISSTEESAIRQAICHMKPMHDYDNLYRAALCRAQADWLPPPMRGKGVLRAVPRAGGLADWHQRHAPVFAAVRAAASDGARHEPGAGDAGAAGSGDC